MKWSSRKRCYLLKRKSQNKRCPNFFSFFAPTPCPPCPTIGALLPLSYLASNQLWNMTLHKAAQAHVRVFVQVARLAKGQSCLASLFSQVLCILIPYLYLSFHLYLYLYTYPDQSGAMYFDLVFVFVFKLVFVFVFSSWLVRCFVIWSCIYMCLHTFIFSSYLYLSLYSHLDQLGALYSGRVAGQGISASPSIYNTPRTSPLPNSSNF